MVNEFEIKKQICEVGRRIYNRNMVATTEAWLPPTTVTFP